MFEDKVYDDLDEMSKLVEPYVYSKNERLSLIPDKIEVAANVILEMKPTQYKWNGDDVNDCLKKAGHDVPFILQPFFEFQVEDLEEGDCVKINFGDKTISHKIFMVKTKIAYDDDELFAMIKRQLTHKIVGALWRSQNVDKPRLNEIADLYGAKAAKSARGYKTKVRELCRHLVSMIDERKLDIRDVDLANRFNDWVISYIRYGNLAALSNITKVKIMTHKNRPIYSIEETETT